MPRKDTWSWFPQSPGILIPPPVTSPGTRFLMVFNAWLHLQITTPSCLWSRGWRAQPLLYILLWTKYQGRNPSPYPSAHEERLMQRYCTNGQLGAIWRHIPLRQMMGIDMESLSWMKPGCESAGHWTSIRRLQVLAPLLNVSTLLTWSLTSLYPCFISCKVRIIIIITQMSQN